MSRRLVPILIVLLWIGTLAVPAQAQSGEPPPATVHIVQQGETLFSIARRHGLTVDAITHANGIPDPRKIYAGQRILIPGSLRDASAENTVPYLVQAGDTLASIARRYDTTWHILVQLNGLLSPDAIHVGQVIQVPSLDAPPAPKGIIRGTLNEGLAYIVRPDDTLFRIALRYGISPWTLAQISHVANPGLLYPGQELVVPGAGAGLLPEPFASVEVQPLPVAQGTTMVVTIRTTAPVALAGRLFEQQVRFAEEGGVYYGLVGVHVFQEPGLYELELTAVDGQGQSTTITAGVVVEAGRFGYERIDLPAGRTSLLDPAVIAADRERLDAVYRTFSAERFWSEPFQRPCAGTVSAYFGSRRSYNGGPYTSYHSGVDFRAPGGTPVYAPAAGTVVLAEPLALWGNAIVIDHGWSVVTGYAHLSAIEVQVGQQVAQGEQIGRVGNTGLSTGAHLHWELRVGGISVNSLQWLEEFYPWPEHPSSSGQDAAVIDQASGTSE